MIVPERNYLKEFKLEKTQKFNPAGREYQKRYYQKNKEKILLRMKKYRETKQNDN